ncbi:hypothetical protein ZYGM_002548 [Zygosaccharomyces mellis]|uniref:Nitrogen regulatory protein areA GATA-like domain-containing protein n=1 Tax=Zygosaccharomyces mellis TaxID=42258 RepID=A0A4C2E5Z7_9SACH|nr:hypothetical protein ZYGM_002548 [Zygosaccharomyces mellis]
MADNLAAFFADRVSQSQTPPVKSNSAPTTPISSNLLDGGLKTLRKTDGNRQDDMGPSVSMAVHANDNDAFHKSTYNLKRTRSMGLLDEYIDPTKKLLGRSDNAEHEIVHSGKSIPLNEPTIHARQVDEDEDEEQADDEGAEDSDIDDENVDVNECIDGDRSSRSRDRTGNGRDDPNRSMSVSPPPADNASILLPQDDNDLMREPERHVDYLSHEWNESDISNSWKYIILKKKKKSSVDQVNAARLENASWRTWAKARNQLRTVSPEIVNWSKDSDVTWLYGPIVRESDNDDKNAEMGYGSDDETSKRMSTPRKKSKDLHGPKPILKKRTVQEILKDNSLWKLSEARKHKHEARYSTSAADASASASVYDPRDAYDDYDALAAKVNAQYYGPKNTHSTVEVDNDNVHNDSVDSSDKPADATTTGSSGQVPQAEDPLASSVGGEGSNDKALKTILTSSNDDGTGSKSRPGRDRHIHFNDRVEQCMAIADPDADSDFTDSGSDQSDNDIISHKSDSIMDGRGSETLANAANFSRNNEDSNTSSSEDGDGDGNDDDEDNAGLFISPAMSRRADSATHSPITDTSSTGSSKNSKFSLNPIIKLLPATTLNHGSDDEASDDSDYDGYGSSVSHNVNTYRGYDYMYDYNSVYTGDTSSFLPVENCDVVDVPEGIDLHSAIAGDNASTYEFNHAALSDLDQETQVEEQQHNLQDQPHVETQQEQNTPLLNSESDNSGFESDEQFIEDSQYHSSDDEEEEDLGLKRAISLGRSSSSSSLKDLSNPQPLNTITPQSRTCSFISGRPLNYTSSLSANNSSFDDVNDSDDNGNHKNFEITSNSDKNNSNSDNKDDIISNDGSDERPKNSHLSLKRAPSSSFIFNSESEDDEDDGSDEADEHNIVSCSPKDSDLQSQHEIGDSPKFSLQSHSKIAPPQSSVILPTSSKVSTASGSQLSDLSKSIRIKNSLSPAEVGASDVAITGSFSPVNESIKSVVTNEGLIGRGSSSLSSSSSFASNQNGRHDNAIKDVNRNLQDCHIDENGCNGVDEQRDSSESVQKMMQNARELANKYLHSWRKGDGNSQGTKSDNKSSGTD